MKNRSRRPRHLRRHDNILKRLLIHVATFNLSPIFRRLLGIGTPRGLQKRPQKERPALERRLRTALKALRLALLAPIRWCLASKGSSTTALHLRRYLTNAFEKEDFATGC